MNLTPKQNFNDLQILDQGMVLETKCTSLTQKDLKKDLNNYIGIWSRTILHDIIAFFKIANRIIMF